VAGKVAWITPANASGGRTQGVGVRFPNDDKTRQLKLKIEEMLGTSISVGQADADALSRAACAAAPLPTGPAMFVDSHCHLSFPELHAACRRDPAPTWPPPGSTAPCASAPRWKSSIACMRWRMATTTSGARWACTPTRRRARAHVDDLLQRCAGRPRVVGIGETGLDYYRLNGRSVADMAWQRERFAPHPRRAAASACRWWCTRAAPARHPGRAAQRRAGRGGRRVPLLHRDPDVARAALDLGFYISFSGILSLPQRRGTARGGRMVPLERCLIETDSPYLAPMPHRGKRLPWPRPCGRRPRSTSTP
jgi:TatD DNase family protein